MIFATVFTGITLFTWLICLIFSFTRIGHYLQPYYFFIGYLIFSTVLLWFNRYQVDDKKSAIGKYARICVKALLVTLCIILTFYAFYLMLNNAFQAGQSPYMEWWDTKISNNSIFIKLLIYIYFIIAILGLMYSYISILSYIANSKKTPPMNVMLILAMIVLVPAILYVMERSLILIKAIVLKYNKGQPFLDLFNPEVLFENMQLWKKDNMNFTFKNLLVGFVIVLMTSSEGIQIALTSQALFNIGRPLLNYLM